MTLSPTLLQDKINGDFIIFVFYYKLF